MKFCMEKIYSEKQPTDNQLKTKLETVNFLLNYSKAFKVSFYSDLKFETILN